MTKHHPLKQYRCLEKGEVVQEGDETDRSADPWKDPPKWEPVLPSEVGEVAPDPQYVGHRLFRRRIGVPASSSISVKIETVTGVDSDPEAVLKNLYEAGSKGFTTCNSSPEEYSVTAKFKSLAEAQAFHSSLIRCWVLVRDSVSKACCKNETRNMNGGCDNCGDPCL